MRLALLIAPALALGACATPREACLSDAGRELRGIDAAIARTEANLARGYAIAVTTDRRRVATTCVRTTSRGRVVTMPCFETATIRDETPLPIDAAEERRRLAALSARRADAAGRIEQVLRACIAAHPE